MLRRSIAPAKRMAIDRPGRTRLGSPGYLTVIKNLKAALKKRISQHTGALVPDRHQLSQSQTSHLKFRCLL